MKLSSCHTLPETVVSPNRPKPAFSEVSSRATEKSKSTFTSASPSEPSPRTLPVAWTRYWSWVTSALVASSSVVTVFAASTMRPPKVALSKADTPSPTVAVAWVVSSFQRSG